jgi:uncharacterized protein YggE
MKPLLLVLLFATALLGCSSADTEPTVASTAPTASSTAATTTQRSDSPTTTVLAAAVTTSELPSVDESTATATVTATQAEAAPVRSITVGGIGTEFATPVRCVVDLGVGSRAPTVLEASRAAAGAADAIVDVLTSSGVASDDIQTSNLSINPFYDDYPIVGGYEMDISYRVTMRDLDRLGSVLAEAIAVGGDDVRASAIRFETDTAGLIDKARVSAWADAEGRAQALAELAGDPLGDVLDVHEKVLITSPYGMVQGGEGDSASFDIPASPGKSGVTVLLTVTFAIGETGE